MELGGEIRERIFPYIDQHQDDFIDNLRQVVEVPSISQQREFRDQTICIVELFKSVSCTVNPETTLCLTFVSFQILEARGAVCELKDLGYENNPDGGDKLALPPVLLGKLGSDPNKRTLCIYGHLDVQPALLEDGWDSEPFKMVEKDGKLYGRGTTDDKGPVMAWINMLDAFRQTQTALPVNLKVRHS